MTYLTYFGLERPLSGDGLATEDAIFRTGMTRQLGTDLSIALSRRDSVAVLYGRSGTGKSTLAHAELKNLSTRLAFAAIDQSPATASELLEQILSDIGCDVFRNSHVERLQLWRQFICEAAATDTRVCLLVEGADTLGLETLKALHQLTMSNATMSPGCNVILTAPSDISVLSDPALSGLDQRVRLRREIAPLTAGELSEYLHFKCARLGKPVESLFTHDAAQEIYERTGGIIRVIDNLLESALASAAAHGDALVTRDRIASVADAQFGLRQIRPEEIDALLSDAPDPHQNPVQQGPIPTLTEFLPDTATAVPPGERGPRLKSR